jgi:mono/diheme cytochrome c family protein
MIVMLLLSSPASAQTDEAAADTYIARCAACHGADGAGGSGPSLTTSTMAVGEIAAVIADGASGMPGFSSDLDSATLDALSAYVATFQSPAASATVTSAPGSSVYFANCAGCHGTKGEGGSGPSLEASTSSIDEIEAVIATGATGMPGYADRLAPGEISAVAALVLDFQSATTPTTTTAPSTAVSQPADGGIEASSGADLYRLACAACHGADGSGGAAASILDTSLDDEGMAEIIETGRGAMPASGDTLTSEQIGEIVTFARGLGAGAATTQPSAGATTTTAEVAAPDTDEADSGPSYWGPLLATLGTFVVVTGGLSLNRRRVRNKVSRKRQEEATE